MNKTNHKIGIGIVVGIALILALFIRPKGPIEADSGHRLIMGTFARVVAVAADSSSAKECIDAAFAELQKVDGLMSSYKSDSEISEVNRNGFKRAVKVSESTYRVLRKSVEFSKLTGGAFDITIGPLADLWRSAAEANSVPTDAELAAARSKIGYEKLLLDANDMSVRFAVDGMKLDLGGIAKGFAVDRAIEAMQKNVAAGGMVDVGGDIRCFGTPPRGKSTWLIGLQDPSEKFEIPIGTGEPLLVLQLTGAAIATSGNYRRFALIEGKKYSHIMDSRTGKSTKGLSSVTIISKNATDADALATAVSVMGAEAGLALIEKLPETEAILIPASTGMTNQQKYNLIKTRGAAGYISN